MKTFSIELKNAEDVVNLVNIASEYDYDVELRSGDMLVDAKSIMGAMAMTGKTSLELAVHSDLCDDLVQELKDHLSSQLQPAGK